MFGCPRSRNAHIERKKSKCDYILPECPTDEQVKAIEDKVNEVIDAAMPVTIEYMSREEAAAIVDLSKLPEDSSETLRIVRVGEYDDCACSGKCIFGISITQFNETDSIETSMFNILEIYLSIAYPVRQAFLSISYA